ncbi:MAG: GNAT family N-acetyltransferase [Myxococcota bacterium]
MTNNNTPTTPRREWIRVEKAKLWDVSLVRALLQEQGLPVHCLLENVQKFFLLRANDTVRGCVGLEYHGVEHHGFDSCLLRSLVVHPDYRGKGYAKMLIKALIEDAQSPRLSEMITVATPAGIALFEQFGFVRIDKEEVNPKMRASWQFNAECVNDVVCMRLTFNQ